MEGDNVALFDDDRDKMDLLERVLADNNIVSKVGSIDEFEAALKKGIFAEVDVAIIDGSLPAQGDGEKIAKELRKKYPNIKIISFAGELQKWGDVNLVKGGIKSVKAIQEAVATI